MTINDIDRELKIIIDLVDIEKEERDMIQEIKGKNKAESAKLIFEYLKKKLNEANLQYSIALREGDIIKTETQKDEVADDILTGIARNDTILRRIEIAENQMRKKQKLNELLRTVFIGVAISSIFPGLFLTNVLSRPVAMVIYIIVLLSCIVYVVYEMMNMKHERNPLSIREKLFKHPNTKMIFQSKILSDMEDVDDKINELEGLVRTVEIPSELMKEYIDNEYEK
jgi:hypothetical protein